MDFSFLTPPLQSLMYGQKAKHVKEAFTRVHERYLNNTLLPLKGRLEHLAYALYRMPATYAALSRVLDHLQEVFSDFSPTSALDLGSGPGTAMIALCQRYSSLKTVRGFERSSEFRTLCEKMAPYMLQRPIHFESHDIDLERPITTKDRVDLVSAVYSLGEISARKEWLFWMASHASCILIVEPGTPKGYACLMECRDALIKEGLHIIAPCPHQKKCPLMGTKVWCHEAVRLPRTRYHRWLKSARLGYEDEKFCYLVATPNIDPVTVESRVIHAPRHRSGHTHITLCCHDGQEKKYVISRRDKELYQKVKRVQWGDSFPDPEKWRKK
jgi:ribosomal protein RSM22 (predicted rRNA methylase)